MQNMKTFSGIHHIALKCGDTEEYVKVIGFYRDTLGLGTVRSWGTGDDAGCMLSAGSDIVEIFATGKIMDGIGGLNHFAFETNAAEDVDTWIEIVRSKGYTVTQEAEDETICSDPPMPIRCAFFTGPLGETIELFYVY